MIGIEKALLALGAKDWIIINESIKWKDDLPLFTEQQINDKIEELKINDTTSSSPKWGQFIKAMEPYFQKGLASNYSVSSQMFNMLILLRDKNLPATATSIEWRNFYFNWNLIKNSLTQEEINEIEAAMKLANIPT